MRAILTPWALVVLITLVAAPARAKVQVVTTLSDYAWAVRAVGGEHVEVEAICPPEQDPHFLAPRPSYALKLTRADLFVDTGLDLELWAPVLLQKAGNARLLPGGPGYLRAAAGVNLRDRPASADRREGDVHIYGNPHITTSPVNMRQVVRNIGTGLARVDPGHAESYRSSSRQVVRDLDERLFGKALVAALGGDTLARLAQQGKLIAFLEKQSFQGRPLIAQLGGWMAALHPHRGKPLVTYHPNWSYFTHLFGLDVVATIELKPGIAPSPRHVSRVLQIVQQHQVPMILAASHYPRGQVESVAKRAGVKAVIVPFHAGGRSAAGYPELVELWVQQLAAGMGPATGVTP